MAKIRIIQLATPNIDQYALYSIASLKKYASIHNYDYFVQRSRTLQDLHINWSKIDVLCKKMEESNNCDDTYIVMVDADTVIVNPKRKIEYFIEKYWQEQTAIFMANDTPLRLNFKKVPNAGFVIVRNDQTGRSIIRKWMHAAYHEGKCYNDTHPRNQLVYWNCVEPHFKKNQVVLPGNYFHKPIWWIPKPQKSRRFLYHVTSTDNGTRYEMMSGYYETVWKDKQNLDTVQSLLNNNCEGTIRLN